MEQVDSLVKQLRCSLSVKSKAEEYFRLAQLKYKALGPSSLAAICVELACHQLEEPVNKVGVSSNMNVYLFCFVLETVSVFKWT